MSKEQIEKKSLIKTLEECECAYLDHAIKICEKALDGDIEERLQSRWKFTAKFLLEAGYRKQSEGEWVQGNDLPKDTKFIPLSSGLYCSNCLSEAYWDSDYGQQKFDYCPNCGAKMKGGAE